MCYFGFRKYASTGRISPCIFYHTMELLNIESLLSIKRRKTARKQKTREGRGEAEVEADKCKDDGFTSLSYPVPQCLQAVAKHGSAHEHCIPPTFPGHNQNSGNITLSARRTLKPLEGSTVIPGEVEAFHFHSSPFSTIDSALQAAQSFPFNGMANSNNNINRTSTQPMTINHIHMNIVRFDLPVASNYRARPFSIEELNAANAADSISILKSFWRNKATRAFPMNNSFEFSGVQNPTTSYCTARQIEPLQFYQANPHLADYTGQHYSISNASNQCNCVDNSSHYEQARIFDGFQQWRQQMEKF